MHHVALYVRPHVFKRSVDFYRELLGMAVVWQPDSANIYLSFGSDNLALHRLPRWHILARLLWIRRQRLDHIGFKISSPAAVDAWHGKLCDAGVPILAVPRDHRDGTRSFYCLDPDGVQVQLIHHPD
jgi:catechol 2,3-dioxygenase-like lactoylglutathione lyase family enzyme